MMRQYELVERVKAYNPKADEGLLNRAYVYAMKAHGTQKRASGAPSSPIRLKLRPSLPNYASMTPPLPQPFSTTQSKIRRQPALKSTRFSAPISATSSKASPRF